jgi:transcriptional regulator
MAKDVTTVRISTELRNKLKKLGSKGETYEEIIERILKVAEGNTVKKSD